MTNKIRTDNIEVDGTETLSGLTASTVLALDASKNIISLPPSGGGTTTFLRADNTWAAPVGGLTGTNLNVGWNGYGGTGSLVFDGSATVAGLAPSSGVYTLTFDLAGLDITVNNGVTIKTAGWRIFWMGTLTNNGVISDDGAAGTSAVTSTPGVNGSNRGSGFYPATISPGNPFTNGARDILLTLSAVVGGTGAAGANGNGGNGGNGGRSQAGSAGGGGGGQFGGAGDGTVGTAIALVSAAAGTTDMLALTRGVAVSSLGSTALTFGGSPAGVGGSGTAGSGSGGAPGGGGVGGGIVFCSGRNIAGNGVFRALGGNGGAGGLPVGALAGGGGGGAGGGGGQVFIFYTHNTGTWTMSAAGGTGGLGGTSAHGSGGNGGNGGAGVTVAVSGDGT